MKAITTDTGAIVTGFRIDESTLTDGSKVLTLVITTDTSA